MWRTADQRFPVPVSFGGGGQEVWEVWEVAQAGLGEIKDRQPPNPEKEP